jgi:molybdate transport system regulatory protein
MVAPHPIFLRLNFDGFPRFGPGKAALLEHIRDQGSITRAGKAMGMSYKRAWSLVEEMNTMFTAPLVESSRGGADGGGARLTETGTSVLLAYRSIEQKSAVAGAEELVVLQGLLSDMSAQK